MWRNEQNGRHHDSTIQRWNSNARVKRVKSAYHARGAKLSQAWSLTKEALAA